jgi:hypothetical protein
MALHYVAIKKDAQPLLTEAVDDLEKALLSFPDDEEI